ncbi:Dps family protein [Paenibacillus elgii]|uniref:Dps family protein n=1 Tax=Paenibacillus elgii TaxID=189691 RepID=UPI0013D89904|nr:DNA starvation/stationary phase protection protein [Paenibacillus elgii]
MANVMEKEKETKATEAKPAKNAKDTKKSSGLHALLGRQVANWAVLHIKIHQHHWYVKGPNFYTLHLKFEELYEEASLTMDQLAERLLSVGGQPVSTTKEIAAAATIKEHEPFTSASDMVQCLRDDFSMVIEETGEAMELAEQEGDEGTHDMLLELKTRLEKHVWMLNAYLNE